MIVDEDRNRAGFEESERIAARLRAAGYTVTGGTADGLPWPSDEDLLPPKNAGYVWLLKRWWKRRRETRRAAAATHAALP